MVARLVLERLDPETLCVEAEWTLDIDDVSFIEDLLGIEVGSERNAIMVPLSPDELGAIERRYFVPTASADAPGRIRRRSKMDDLPYKTHTNRELKLMLSGVKPMSVFSARYPSVGDETEVCDQPFGTWVENGRLSRYEEIVFDAKDPTRGVVYYIYTLPDEFWRAKAFILLKKAGAKSGWSIGMERLEGMLLGYTDSEIDIYIEMMVRKPT